MKTNLKIKGASSDCHKNKGRSLHEPEFISVKMFVIINFLCSIDMLQYLKELSFLLNCAALIVSFSLHTI